MSADEVLEFAEGRLKLARRTAIEEHLDLCTPCRALLVEVVRGGGPAATPSRHGRYEIERPIGAGAMGVIYAARDPQLDRRVALKLLRPGGAPGTSASERRALALREARAMAQLSHPNVLAVHEAFEDGEQLFVVMELVEGGTLAEWLREKPRALPQVLDVFTQAGRGLAAAHAAGLVHRDFKPENVLIGNDGRVRVTDFGFAVRASSAAGASGSPGYMAPEQMRGEAPDARADIFSFCAALYEALTEELPFCGGTLDELLRSIEAGPRRGARLPRRLREVLARGLQADRERRFSSMEALLDALTESRRRRGRSRWLWLSAVAGLLVVGAGVSIASRLRAPQLWRVRQLSRTPYAKPSIIATDGNRLYFSQTMDGVITPVSLPVSGEGAPVPIAGTPADSLVAGLSPDGSQLLLAQVVAGGNSWPLWTKPLGDGPARRLGDARLGARDITGAAWSPDGRKIAYGFHDEVRVIDVDGTHDHLLARSGFGSFWPRWSPDGRRLRFTVDGDRILEVPADGGPTLPVDIGGRSACCGDWSRDGRSFFFVTEQEGYSSINDIWAMREGVWRALSPPARLTSGPLDMKRPASSPDGATLFALGYQRMGELARWNPANHSPEPFLGGISADMLAWSPDRASIAYVTFPEGSLWRSRADGSERVQLTRPPLHVSSPAWSPDGQSIAFSAFRSGEHFNAWKTFVLPASGGVPLQVGHGDEVDFGPTWSADGKSLLMSGFVPGPPSSVRWVELASGAQRTLPGSAGLCCSFATAGGSAIFAIAPSPTRLMRYATGAWKEVYRGRLDNYVISGDGRWAYFVDEGEKDPAIYRVAADGGAPEWVVSLASLPLAPELGLYGGWFGLAPDGSLLLLRDVGSQQVFALDLSY